LGVPLIPPAVPDRRVPRWLFRSEASVSKASCRFRDATNARFLFRETGITAAVMGVILNLGLFFGWHVLWPKGTADAPFAGDLGPLSRPSCRCPFQFVAYVIRM
jgi:hypothetical protein